MATNPKDNIDISKETLTVLQNYIRAQGDYRDIVKDSATSINSLNKELQKQSDVILDIINKEKGYANLKKKVAESKVKELIADKKLKELSKELSLSEQFNAIQLVENIEKKIQAEKLYEQAVRSGNVSQQKQQNAQIAYLEKEIELQEQNINVKELEYAAAERIARTRRQATKDIEKEITLGMKLKNTVGNVYNKTTSGISATLGAITGKGDGFGSMIDKSVDMLKMIPGVGGAIGGLIGGMKALFDFIVEIEDKTVKFGRNLGYSREESFQIRNNFANIATSSGNLLITTENLMEVQTDLSQQLQVNNILTGEMLSTQVELKKVMGLTTDEMGELAKTSIISGQNQKQVVTGVLSQVAGLKAATGISFNYKQIIGEVTKLGGVLGLQFAKYPEKLTKSLLVTKALGMDLAKVDQIAGNLLDFESSIQNQLEAQLLTGKNINLSKAQQLALDGDTAGVAMELTKQFGSAQEFLDMNRIQQEAIAKAVGMERNELADVLKNQEMLTKLGAKDTDNNQRKLELALQRYKTEENINKALGEGAYQNLTQLSAQEKMAALIDKVKGALQDFLTKSGVVEYVTGLIQKLTNPENVKGLINMLKEGVATLADMIEGIAYSLLNVANAITFGTNDKIQSMIEKMDESENVGDKIRSLGVEKNSANVKDFVIKPLGEDTITMAGGTKLGRTDEMVDLLKQLLNETRQGKVMSVNIDGAPVATAVARNAPMNYAASNLGPRPLR
jgi:hypothetical protein